MPGVGELLGAEEVILARNFSFIAKPLSCFLRLDRIARVQVSIVAVYVVLFCVAVLLSAAAKDHRSVGFRGKLWQAVRQVGKDMIVGVPFAPYDGREK